MTPDFNTVVFTYFISSFLAAIICDIAVCIPAAYIVKHMPNTGKTSWYIPNILASITFDRYILYANPIIRVINPVIVRMAVPLMRVFNIYHTFSLCL